ncbi:MAG: alkaline phosphatase family protein [Acidimicrobiia bacterium]
MAVASGRVGNGLSNLISEIEQRLTGSAPSRGLRADLASSLPDASTYVIVLFDGLGMAQLTHPAAGSMRRSLVGPLTAPFPTTTPVSLATVASGLEPGLHGLVAHLLWIPELETVVNTLKWVDLAGRPVAHDYASMLPQPNVWERLRRSGVEPITVQPGAFMGSPLSRLLYRGARFEPSWNDSDLVDATLQLASEPRRLIFTYIWQVDFAGHVSGLESPQFDDAMKMANQVWEDLATGLPPDAALIGTADHGLTEYAEDDKVILRGEPWDRLRFGGDPRGVHLWGDVELARDLAELTGGTLVDPESVFEPITDVARRRLGDQLLLAPPGRVLLPPGFDKRLRCYHGGLDPAESEIPLLVG